METLAPIWILTAVFAPFAAAAAIALTPGRWAEPWSYLATAITVLCAALLLPAVLGGEVAAVSLLTILPGMDIAFNVDALGMTFGMLASGLWVLATLYSSGYVRAEEMAHRPRYFACFAASIGSAMGVAFAGNVFTFLLFYELLTLATYPLVAHKESQGALAAGRRYLAFALSGGLAVTVAAVWTWSLTGTLDFTPGGFLEGQAPWVLSALFVLYIVGCGVKAAIMPMHSWLPAAMVAPSPVSALLHAVAVVKAGVFGCIRILGFVFGPETLSGMLGPDVLLGFCAATILAGSVIALRQDNLKRRLAYSTIVHLSYIVLGAALVAPLGMVGAVLHMVNHGLCKITLFFCAGAIDGTTHKKNISEMAGLGRRMPWTFGAFTVASLGLIGMPGLCGFVSKMFLAGGAYQANELAYMGIMLGGSLFTAAYLLPIVRTAYFDPPHPTEQAGLPEAVYADRVRSDTTTGERKEDEAHHETGEARPAMVVPLLGTAALVVMLGIIPPAIGVQYELAAGVAEAVFGEAP